MKREIKFRGFNEVRNQWMFGYLFKYPNGRTIIYESDSSCCGVLPSTVGQFTGLKDGTGKEIYEGDILRLTGSTSNLTVEVVYNEEDTSFTLKLTSINAVSARTLGSWLSLGYECAIIDNVHDNPELMKGGSNEA